MALTFPEIEPGTTTVGDATDLINNTLVVTGIAADFTSENPTLALGRGGLETDTGKLKVGDGVTAWEDLDYIGPTGFDSSVATGIAVGEAFEAVRLAGGADAAALAAEIAEQADLGGDAVEVAEDSDYWEATSGLFFETPEASAAAEAWVQITPDGSENVAFDGELGFNQYATIDANAQITGLTNLIPGKTYTLRLTASGGTRTVGAAAADILENFGGGVSLTSGSGADFIIKSVAGGDTLVRFTQPGSGGATLADADYGDIVVSSSGAAMNIDTGVITAAARTVLDDASVADMRTTMGIGTGDSPEFAAINLSHASANTLTGSGGELLIEGNAVYRAGGTDVPVADGGTGSSTAAAARTALAVVGSAGGEVTGGFSMATAFAAGTKSSGTFTPDPASGNVQTATNGGAHTLAPPTNSCNIVIQYTNNGSAGAITTSGFTKVDGAFTTTNGDDFFAFITKVGSFSYLNIVALQ